MRTEDIDACINQTTGRAYEAGVGRAFRNTDSQRWFIYALGDPFTLRIMYVGMTRNPFTRLKGHLAGSTNGAMKTWIRGLKWAGARPYIALIKPVDGSRQRALAIEAEMIDEYRIQFGHPLLNQR